MALRGPAYRYSTAYRDADSNTYLHADAYIYLHADTHRDACVYAADCPYGNGGSLHTYANAALASSGTYTGKCAAGYDNTYSYGNGSASACGNSYSIC